MQKRSGDDYEHRVAETLEVVRSDKENRRIRVSASSEKAVERWDHFEILQHSPASVDMSWIASGNAPFLSEHDRWGGTIGVVEKAFLKGGRLMADVRFGNSPRAQAEFRDVVDGIRRNVSIGYSVASREEHGTKDGKKVFRATSWKPMEISLVSIPADDSVGTNRAQRSSQKGTAPMGKKKDDKAKLRAALIAGGYSESDADRMVSRMTDSAAQNSDTLQDCLALQREGGVPPYILESVVQEGGGLEAYRKRAWEWLKSQRTANPEMQHHGVAHRQHGQEFSISRLIRAAMEPNNARLMREAQHELEVCDQFARDAKVPEVRGYTVPLAALSTRTLQASTGTGASLVGETVDGSKFAEFLRARSVIMEMGATVMDWSGSNLSIPRNEAGVNAVWLPENDPVTPTDPTLNSLALSPKTLMAATDYSKRLLYTSSPTVDQIVAQDLAAAIAEALDAAVIQGTGTNQPQGLIGHPDLPTPLVVAAAIPTFAEIVAAEQALADVNHLVGALGYVIPPSLLGGLKTQDKGTDTGNYVLETGGGAGDPSIGVMNGYRTLASSSCPVNNFVFGAWAELYVCFFGPYLDLVVDPFSRAREAAVAVTAHCEIDAGPRRGKSFIVSTYTP